MTFSDVWEKSTLTYTFINENPINLPNERDLEVNLAYKSDNEYSKIIKNFHSLTESLEEKNVCDSYLFLSDFNPAHTTLFPDDIEAMMEKMRFLKTKNALKREY